jgi:dienelactone hydrolase
VLKFVSGYLALSYLAFAALGVAGILQALAAWHPYVGLALLDYRQSSLWKRAVGPGLIVLAYAWFFGTRREILTPGPAGAELTLLFGGAVLLALVGTLAGASLLQPYQRQQAKAAAEGEIVRLEHGQQGMLYLGVDRRARLPGVCLVPDPGLPETGWQAVAGRLAQAGIAVLVPAWPIGRQRFPDALSLVPLAMDYLSRHPRVDAERLAVGGIGLGADLALRAASGDRQIRAVVALGPLLAERYSVPGLGLLREMTYPQAMAWGLGGRRRRLVRDLDAVAAVTQMRHQAALVLYGSRDALVPPGQAQALLAPAGVPVRTVPGETHASLAAAERSAEMVSQWLTEKLHES